MRGGTRTRLFAMSTMADLSPHARGNPGRTANEVWLTGSIPACAGEPHCQTSENIDPWVYPRMRGGTEQHDLDQVVGQGLSPHARGNRLLHDSSQRTLGSIPACAGEPCTPVAGVSPPQVYPRMRGGTVSLTIGTNSFKGLSPHARGNHISLLFEHAGRGSIPACAGEPVGDKRTQTRHGVYPRMRGGTNSSSSTARALEGLSPHARGNHHTVSVQQCRRGSIPACAGEPAMLASRTLISWVYPRMRGGTPPFFSLNLASMGLSPHARGNLHRVGGAQLWRGSIPACAGEPQSVGLRSPWAGVYPRMRGGTVMHESSDHYYQGLSPHARGNHLYL